VHADAIGIEVRSVMLGGPRKSGLLVGECDGGLVVVDASDCADAEVRTRFTAA